MIDEKNHETETQNPSSQEEELQEELHQQKPSLEDELKEINNKYLLVLAELENTRKRMYKEKAEAIQFAIENTICEFLPVIENFEKALGYADNLSGEVKNWASGFQMFLTQFREILHDHSIVAFHSEGNFFDPHYHEAVETVSSAEHPDGMIIEEYSKGYKTPKRVIRPAKVQVAKAEKEELQKKGENHE